MMTGSRDRLRLLLTGATLAVMALCIPAGSNAQDGPTYDELRLEPLNRDEDRVFSSMLSSGQVANKEVLERKIKYELARLTHLDALGSIGDVRSDIKMRYLLQSGKRESLRTHDEMVKVVFPLAKQIAEGNYHPFSKASAMLVIADLNDKEPQTTGGGQPPICYEPALEYLVAKVSDPATPEPLVAAALYGIHRHAQFGIAKPQLLDQTRELLVGLTGPGSEDAPRNRWIRQRALRALGRLATPGPQNQVINLMVKIASDDGEPLMFRAEAYRALGFINQQNANTKIADQALLGGRLILAAADQQGRQNWDLQKAKTMQQVLGFVSWGLRGPDENVSRIFNPGSEGSPVRGAGIRSAANDQAKQVVEGINQRVQSLMDLVFTTGEIELAQLISQIQLLEGYLNEVSARQAASNT